MIWFFKTMKYIYTCVYISMNMKTPFGDIWFVLMSSTYAHHQFVSMLHRASEVLLSRRLRFCRFRKSRCLNCFFFLTFLFVLSEFFLFWEVGLAVFTCLVWLFLCRYSCWFSCMLSLYMELKVFGFICLFPKNKKNKEKHDK